MTSLPIRHFGAALAAIVALGGCTEVVDKWATGDANGSGNGSDVGTINQGVDFCDPEGDGNAPGFQDDDPCRAMKRECDPVAEECTNCLEGYKLDIVYDESGSVINSFCVKDGGGGPAGDCTATARQDCAKVNKECVGVSCGDCLPGYIESETGSCLPQSACYPNPCTEPLRTVCQIGPDGQPVCQCDGDSHDDGAGNCTFDPCTPNPCVAPVDVCVPNADEYSCACSDGLVVLGGDCYPDPCDGIACTEPGRSTCIYDAEGKPECICDTNFLELDGSCVEAQASNGSSAGVPTGAVEIDDSRQLFVDDWLVYLATNMDRRLHPVEGTGGGWVVPPTLEDGIGRARTGGSLVLVDQASLNALPNLSPLKPYPWRLYYMGYRQQFSSSLTSQPAWVCLAVATHPVGPWSKPAIRPGTLGENCVLMVDGLVDVEVTRREGEWTMSATRLAMGSNTQAGLYVYRSLDGVSWLPDGGAMMALEDSVVSPAIYPRIGSRSRLTWDAWEQRFVGIVALPSSSYGDARGIVEGDFDPTQGWPFTPTAVTAPAILGPSSDELAQDKNYTDMAAWREGGLWLSLVLRQKGACPQVGEVFAASSRDGRNWVPIVDDVTQQDVLIAPSAIEGLPDASIDSLSGGQPAEADGEWHYLVGGTDQAICSGSPANGGVLRYVGRAGGIAGLAVSQAPGVVITRPMQMREGVIGAGLAVDAVVEEKVKIQIEALSSADTVLAVTEAILGPGDHHDTLVASEPLHAYTADRFRIRFTFPGPGEIFGFRLYDPACKPNPCTVPGRTVCDSVSGQAVCLCDPPAHDDGNGGCTTDPCVPDPCTGPNQLGCTVVSNEAVCGCVDGWVPKSGTCVPDPCLPQNAPAGVACPPPENRCRVSNGEAICYCPEGSTGSPAGCVETDDRIFVTSLAARGDTLGGPGGADSLCSTLANAAGLPGTYGAWLSSPEGDAIDRFANGGPWRTWDEEMQLWTKLVASDIWDLTDGTLETPINKTEFGAAVPGNCLVWTGTSSDGEMSNTEGLGGTCSGWTSADEGFGLAGLCDASDELWTEWAPALCTKESRFYCLQLP